MKKYQRSSEWTLRLMGNGDVGLLSPKVSFKTDLTNVIQLNGPSIFIWQQLENPHAEDELMKCWLEKFSDSGEPQEELAADLIESLKNFKEMGLISVFD